MPATLYREMLPNEKLLTSFQSEVSVVCALQGDLLLIAAGAPAVVHKSLDRVRQYVASSLGEVDSSKHSLLWVTGQTAPSAYPSVNDYFDGPSMQHRSKSRAPTALLVSAFLLCHFHLQWPKC